MRVELCKQPIHQMSWQAIKLALKIETDTEAMFIEKIAYYKETYLRCQKLPTLDQQRRRDDKCCSQNKETKCEQVQQDVLESIPPPRSVF